LKIVPLNEVKLVEICLYLRATLITFAYI